MPFLHQRLSRCLAVLCLASSATLPAANAAQAQASPSAVAAKFSVMARFPQDAEQGAAPLSLMWGMDDYHYGTTTEGGAGGRGVAYRMNAKGKLKILYSFGLQPNDPAEVKDALIRPGGGEDFYGVGEKGGQFGAGAVFRLTRAGRFKLLHSFASGEAPRGSIMRSDEGPFYGVSTAGGANNNGFVYQLHYKGEYVVLHSFGPASQAGEGFEFGLVQGTDHQLYGVSTAGGPHGQGTLYRVSRTGEFAVVHAFAGSEGGHPRGGLTLGADGWLYGTTAFGGMKGGGVLFKVDTSGNYVKIVDFDPDGPAHGPLGNLTIGSDGNFYGVAAYNDSQNQPSAGAVYQATPSGAVTALHAFVQRDDGGLPRNGVVEGPEKTFAGVTSMYGRGNSIGTAYRVILK